ncbi:hypothetical protein GGS21DRAFT_275822 [Xylaria nigripes]|nr:hypothetical protein GGS21DRAFT_275822 [Xylaria nigripes]
MVRSTRSLYIALTSCTSARSSSTSSLFSPNISSVVWYLSFISLTSFSRSATLVVADLFVSSSRMSATISPRASSRWPEIRVSSSLAATFSLSRRRMAALILSTSCTEGPAVIVETEAISSNTFGGDVDLSRPSSTSSRSVACIGGEAMKSRPLPTEGAVAVGKPVKEESIGVRAEGGWADVRLVDHVGRSLELGSPLLEGAEVLRNRFEWFCSPRKLSPLKVRCGVVSRGDSGRPRSRKAATGTSSSQFRRS